MASFERVSVKYKVVRKLYDELVHGIKDDLGWFIAMACAKSLVTPDESETLKDQSEPPYDRALRFMAILGDKIKLNDQFFDTFLSILCVKFPSLTDTVQKRLESLLQEEGNMDSGVSHSVPQCETSPDPLQLEQSSAGSYNQRELSIVCSPSAMQLPVQDQEQFPIQETDQDGYYPTKVVLPSDLVVNGPSDFTTCTPGIFQVSVSSNCVVVEEGLKADLESENQQMVHHAERKLEGECRKFESQIADLKVQIKMQEKVIEKITVKVSETQEAEIKVVEESERQAHNQLDSSEQSVKTAEEKKLAEKELKDLQMALLRKELQYETKKRECTKEIYEIKTASLAQVWVQLVQKEEEETRNNPFPRRRRRNAVDYGHGNLFLILEEERHLKARFETARHLKAFETALTEKGSLEQTIIHCLFFGHPRGGKSSLMKRLTGHPPTPNIPSTGVVQKVEIYTTTAMEMPHFEWSMLTFDDEAIALMATATQSFSIEKATQPAPIEPPITDLAQPAPFEPPITDLAQPAPFEPPITDLAQPAPFEPLTKDPFTDTISSIPTDDVAMPTAPADIMEVFKQAIKRRGLDGVEQYLQDSLILYLTDTGGQMEFQELLPALVAGPTVFFVVFRLDQDLNKTFTIEYLRPDGQSAEPYQSSFSVKETLLQSLVSIASMGTYIYSKKLKKQVPLKPKVVLVGTHKDNVSSEKTAQIDCELQQMVKATSLYRHGLIEFASESQLVVTVNNLSHNDSDFQLVRSVVKRITDRGDFKVSSPSTWFIFSLIIRQQKKRVITYDKCFDIAQKCSIDSRDELNEVLWFLNTKLGLVRHFRGEGLEELEEIVIVDPQILFDKITKLIVHTFTFRNVDSDVYEEFKRRGIFPRNVLEQLSSSDDLDQLLTTSRLIKLLEHLHVIARLYSDSEEVKYFMPCTLAHARSTVSISADPPSLLSSFLITFKCGYCPKGLFSALCVFLLANKMKSCFKWELQTDQIFKNAISLSVGPFDTMTLSLTPTYIEVSVVPANKIQKRMFPIDKTCTEVRRCIETAIREVTLSLNYIWDAEHTLAFYCPGDHEGLKDKHPAIVQYYDNQPCSIRCELTQQKLSYDLPSGYQDWFHEHSAELADSSHCPSMNSDARPVVSDTCHEDCPPESSLASTATASPALVLSTVTEYLLDLDKSQVYNLGISLGLSFSRVKSKFDSAHDTTVFLDQIIGAWLQRVDQVDEKGGPSWETLVAALRSKRLKLTGIASDIEKHCVV